MSAYCRYTAEIIAEKDEKISEELLTDFYNMMCKHVMDAVMCDMEDVLSTGQFEGDCNISVCRYKNVEDVLNFAKKHNVRIEFIGSCEERWWDSYLLVKPDGTFEESEGLSEESDNIEEAMRWELENLSSPEEVDDLKSQIESLEGSDKTKHMYLEIVNDLIENEFPELKEEK